MYFEYNLFIWINITMKKSNERLTIGILSSPLGYEYQILIWAGIRDAAKEIDANTICFTGAEINSPDIMRNERASIFEMISSKNIDGLIVVSSTACGFMKTEEIEKYFEKYKHMPMVSIGIPIQNIPSIIVDNKYGFKYLVDHLIEVHGCKKFLYVGGPINSFEARERLAAFKESLIEHNITIKPEHIIAIDFTLQQAYYKVLDILNKESDFDAIASANDNMAIGVIKALQEKNISIPDETAVIGFDDTKRAGMLLTPLTTVKQPAYEMAKKALKTLVDEIKGEEVLDLEIMKTEPIIRKSCGCLKEVIFHLSVKDLTLPDSDILDYIKIKDSILNELKEKYLLTSKEEKIEEYDLIIDEFFNFIRDQISDNDFIIKLDKILRKIISYFFDSSVWEGLFFLLRKKILPFFLNQPQMIIKIEDLIHQSRIIINDISIQVETDSFIQLLIRAKVLNSTMGYLFNSFNFQILLDKMASELPKIGISSCYLSIHSSNVKKYKEAKLILAYNKNGRIKLDKDGFLFSSEQLFPRDLIKSEERYDYILEPLIYEREHLGFVVLELDPFKDELLTIMSDQIRSAIKASMLLQETIEKSKKLEDALYELYQNQGKLIISEKMASLGRLTAGIAHEMNTPLATVRASLSEIMNLINEYKNSLSNPEITIEDHNSISNDMMQSTKLAIRAIEKAAGFIKSIKSQTREIDDKDKIRFNAVDIINESILLLSHVLKKTNLSIDFKFSNKEILVFGLPGKFSQVVTNLITNAIDAMVEKKGENINIELMENVKNIILKVQDRGCGIPESILTKIFDPLYTTKPFGQGTGLGLTIVHEIVHGEFYGYIEVESKVNIGTTFNIYFNKII